MSVNRSHRYIVIELAASRMVTQMSALGHELFHAINRERRFNCRRAIARGALHEIGETWGVNGRQTFETQPRRPKSTVALTRSSRPSRGVTDSGSVTRVYHQYAPRTQRMIPCDRKRKGQVSFG